MMQTNRSIDDDEENEAVGEMTAAMKTVMIALNLKRNLT